jgi:hypothetical protein
MRVKRASRGIRPAKRDWLDRRAGSREAMRQMRIAKPLRLNEQTARCERRQKRRDL